MTERHFQRPAIGAAINGGVKVRVIIAAPLMKRCTLPGKDENERKKNLYGASCLLGINLSLNLFLRLDVRIKMLVGRSEEGRPHEPLH